MIIIISLPPVSRQVVPQQFKIVQWTKSICPYMTLDHYSCLPILSASFCHLYLPSKYTLTETTRGIHFSEDSNGVSRETLGSTYTAMFKTNLGSPIPEYRSERDPHPLSLLCSQVAAVDQM